MSALHRLEIGQCIRLCIAALLICAAMPIAIASEYLIRPITLDNGLSQSTVRCVLRDRKGYLWIGTNYGLNRYDNNRVTPYYRNDADEGSIPDNEVNFIVLDNNGDLLVGFGRGLARYDYGKNVFEALTVDGKSIDVRSALAVSDGTLIGGFGKLYFYNSKTREVKALPAKGGSSLSYDNIAPSWLSGHYVLQTYYDGLWLYDSGSSQIKRLKFCPDKHVRNIAVDSKGHLWVAVLDNGIRCYDQLGKQIADIRSSNSALSNDRVMTLVEYEGAMWAGTERGIDIIDIDTFNVETFHGRVYGPDKCAVQCLSPDQNHTIYAGTLRHGVICIYEAPMRTFNQFGTVATMFGFTVTSVVPADDGKKVWVGFDGDGVALFDPEAGTFKRYHSTDDMKVTSLVSYGKDRLLVAVYGKGLYMLDTRTGAMTPMSSLTSHIDELTGNKECSIELCALNDGRILGVTDALFSIEPTTGKVEMQNFTAIRGIIEKMFPFYGDRESVLLSDRHNIYRYVTQDDTCGVIFSVGPDEAISCASYNGADGMWIATNKGLLKHNIANGATDSIKFNLLHNVNSLLIENDRIWIGADNKLYMKNGESLTLFGESDGMEPNQFINKAQLITDDCLLLGGVNGLLKINRSDIDRLVDEHESTEISLSDFYIDNARANIPVGEDLIVPNNHASVTINLIEHDNSGVKNKLFRYIVSGPSRKLVMETFDRSITLNMLSPGSYKVDVAYCATDGMWSEPMQLVEFEVQRPWWQRWPAMLAFVLAVIIGVSILYVWMRVRRKRKIDEVRRGALIDKVNFLTRVHDELRTPLTLILSPLNALIGELRRNGNEGHKDTISALEGIYHNSLQMRDIIDTLPESHNVTLQAISGTRSGADATEREYDADEAKGGVVESFDTTPYTAIVVETDEKLRSFIVSHLQSMFKQVEVARNAHDAMIKVRDMHPDIVIADVDLSDGSGFDLCSTMKSTKGMRHIPVILLTSGSAEEQLRKSSAHGADGYISKPFEINTLISRSKNLLLNRSIMRGRYDKSTPADQIAAKAVSNNDESFIIELNQLLSEHISSPDFCVEFLAKKMRLGRTAFYARMRQITDKSIGQYISDFRIDEAKKMLANESLQINEIAEALGFSSQRYFSKFFKDKTGMAPTEYRASKQ